MDTRLGQIVGLRWLALEHTAKIVFNADHSPIVLNSSQAEVFQHPGAVAVWHDPHANTHIAIYPLSCRCWGSEVTSTEGVTYTLERHWSRRYRRLV